MTAFLRARATGRNVLFGIALVAILALLMQFVVAPVYRSFAAGFDPMTMQVPLTRTMIAVQRGAFSPGLPIIHIEYTAVQMFLLANQTLLTMLLWCWLAARVPGSLGDRMLMRGLLYLPLATLLCGIAENAFFLKLVFANPHDPRHDLTTLTLAVHRLAAAMRMTTTVVTVGMIVDTLVTHFQRNHIRRAG